LAAFFMHHLVGIVFTQRKISLQNALGPIHCLPRFQPVG